MASEQEDLDQLLHSQGWLHLKQYADRYWGEQHEQHVRAAANELNDTTAIQKLRQVIAAKEAVMNLLRWPGERLKTLESAEAGRVKAQSEPLSRRGSL